MSTTAIVIDRRELHQAKADWAGVILRASKALKAAESVTELKIIATQAETCRAYVKAARIMGDLAAEFLMVKLRAERRIGELMPDGMNAAAGGAEYGMTEAEVRRCRLFAGVEAEEFDRLMNDVHETNFGGLSTTALVNAIKGRGRREATTPEWFRKLNGHVGHLGRVLATEGEGSAAAERQAREAVSALEDYLLCSPLSTWQTREGHDEVKHWRKFEGAPVSDKVQALGAWKDNGALIEALVKIGYLREEWRTLDPTYGRGTWWKYWRPAKLTRHDLKLDGVDFRHLPHRADWFDAVAFDPPYKLNGTATPDVDERYGVEEYRGWKGRHDLIRQGIDECLRVLKPEGILLVKCADQVSSGAVRWQTREFAEHTEWGEWRAPAEALCMAARTAVERWDGGDLAEAIRALDRASGEQPRQRATLIDAFLMAGGREQPEGRRQVHAERKYSTMLVFRKAKAPKVKR